MLTGLSLQYSIRSFYPQSPCHGALYYDVRTALRTAAVPHKMSKTTNLQVDETSKGLMIQIHSKASIRHSSISVSSAFSTFLERCSENDICVSTLSYKYRIHMRLLDLRQIGVAACLEAFDEKRSDAGNLGSLRVSSMSTPWRLCFVSTAVMVEKKLLGEKLRA